MFILNEITMNCGATSLTIDSMLPQLVTTAVNLIKIGIPVLLIIFGMMDLGKAVMAQKEDEIKKDGKPLLKEWLLL